MFDWGVLIVAATAAGLLNAIAGGGSFLTFPALVYVGLPPVAANATSAVAVFPGYLGAAAGFRQELAHFARARLWRLTGLSLIGGLLGALLLLVTSNEVFDLVVPWLLLFATLLFALGPRLMGLLGAKRGGLAGAEGPLVFLVAVYGGYFNGGLGIVLLALFILLGIPGLNLMNGLKNGLSFVISAISVATFALAGIVHWPQALVMMVAATLGGYLGARLARVLPVAVVRAVITLVGLSMTLVFFARL